MICISKVAHALCFTDTPIIGIIANEIAPSMSEYGKSSIYEDIVVYIESAGGRAIPILPGKESTYYDNLFFQLNGIVIPGGNASMETSEYFLNTLYFMNQSRLAYNNGEVFPIFGICMGFETMLYILSGRKQVLSYTPNIDYINLPFLFTTKAKKSMLFGKAAPDIILTFTNPINANMHNFSVLMSEYKKSKLLKKSVKVLATSVAKSQEFIAAFESSEGLSWFGVQSHPEMNSNNFKLKFVDHSSETIVAMQHLAKTFIGEARKSCHKFESERSLKELEIHNFNLLRNVTTSSFYDSYYVFQ